MTEAPAIWPPARLVQKMQNGTSLIFRTGTGLPVTGLRSLHPWIYYAFECGAVCERCVTLEKAPAPPASRGLNGQPEPLFGVQTKDYALFMLSWLHGFAGRHSICEPPAEVAAA